MITLGGTYSEYVIIEDTASSMFALVGVYQLCMRHTLGVFFYAYPWYKSTCSPPVLRVLCPVSTNDSTMIRHLVEFVGMYG